jgi:hypothetical protein
MEKVMEQFFCWIFNSKFPACTDPANWKTCQGLSHQRKIEKCLSMRAIRQHRCRVYDFLNCQLLLHNPLRWIQLIIYSNSSKWHTTERNPSGLTLRLEHKYRALKINQIMLWNKSTTTPSYFGSRPQHFIEVVSQPAIFLCYHIRPQQFARVFTQQFATVSYYSSPPQHFISLARHIIFHILLRQPYSIYTQQPATTSYISSSP